MGVSGSSSVGRLRRVGEGGGGDPRALLGTKND